MDIEIKAGSKVFELIKDGGFHFDRITTYVGPAVGPRWLVASGFDLTLLNTGVLAKSKPVLLAGASAGAWRFASWLQPEPIESYRALLDAYIAQTYSREDTPGTIMRSLSRIINAFIDNDALSFALANRKYRLAITTARGRNLNGSDAPWVQKVGLLCALIANTMSPSLLHKFFERVVFYCAPLPPRFCLRDSFMGKAIPLNETNFKDALLASGAIPLLVAGIKNIFGSPNGTYRDGGIFDYHLNHEYTFKEGELTLLFHHCEKIIPGWLDKKIKSRRVSGPMLDNVLMIHPSRDFVESLPAKKVPDRDDFVTFADRPERRIEMWRKAVASCAHLGEEFLEVAGGSRLRDVVQKF
jgi:hypothetical protein